MQAFPWHVESHLGPRFRPVLQSAHTVCVCEELVGPKWKVFGLLEFWAAETVEARTRRRKQSWAFVVCPGICMMLAGKRGMSSCRAQARPSRV